MASAANTISAQSSVPVGASRAMERNIGAQPRESIGRRVHVRLRNGTLTRREGRADAAGWQADTARWSLTGSDFDIVAWELAA
ncbi:hypothetical protein [Novosphingobium rosa]|uniref:hypothetical protein n=1 Tax=Novosphingobium rosa TaxID=76978 RepID=UPI000A9F8432|nr:hypothetical protein [Novosphingobium rosa]